MRHYHLEPEDVSTITLPLAGAGLAAAGRAWRRVLQPLAAAPRIDAGGRRWRGGRARCRYARTCAISSAGASISHHASRLRTVGVRSRSRTQARAAQRSDRSCEGGARAANHQSSRHRVRGVRGFCNAGAACGLAAYRRTSTRPNGKSGRPRTLTPPSGNWRAALLPMCSPRRILGSNALQKSR